MNNIYVVFSATPYLIGKAIRHVTGQTYNHVSIALDENLAQMYGFARRFYRTPLYGGFVKETLSRYQVNGKATQICVCKLPVTEDQYNALAARLNIMFSDKKRSNDQIALVIPNRIGQCELRKMPISQLKEYISPGFEE